jgi:translocation and assembly module TamA
VSISRGYAASRVRWRLVSVAIAAVLLFVTPHVVRAVSVSTTIDGISDKELLTNVEVSLGIARAADDKKLTPERILAMHARAAGEIERALQPFGYYAPTIDASLVEKKDGKYEARYRVDPGPPTRVVHRVVAVTGEGKDRPPFPDIVSGVTLHTGDILDQRVYERIKSSMATAAADSGYLDARFVESKILVDAEHRTGDIDLVFDTGPRFYFGPVRFDSSVVNERVLRAHVNFKRGEPFRYDKLLALQSELGGMPYFSRVEVVPRRDLGNGTEVPIDVHLSPRAPWRFEIGAGYGTDTGARVRFDTELRRLNRSGHRFNGRINVSEIELSLYADYFIPSLYPKKHAYSIGAEISQLDPVAYTTTRKAVGVTRSQPRFGLHESFQVAFEDEDFTVASNKGTSDLLIGAIQYRLKRANDDVWPTRGYRLTLGARASSVQVASTQSFISVALEARTVRSFGPVRLLGRVDAGRTFTAEFHKLPPTIRFFAGGDYSVRGYDYESLGPVDADGHVVGGDVLLVGSLELELPLVSKVSVAGFADVGNAFDSHDLADFEKGVGGGLRWRSPVGPIGADLAFPVNHDGWKIHIVMGPFL